MAGNDERPTQVSLRESADDLIDANSDTNDGERRCMTMNSERVRWAKIRAVVDVTERA